MQFPTVLDGLLWQFQRLPDQSGGLSVHLLVQTLYPERGALNQHGDAPIHSQTCDRMV